MPHRVSPEGQSYEYNGGNTRVVVSRKNIMQQILVWFLGTNNNKTLI